MEPRRIISEIPRSEEKILFSFQGIKAIALLKRKRGGEDHNQISSHIDGFSQQCSGFLRRLKWIQPSPTVMVPAQPIPQQRNSPLANGNIFNPNRAAKSTAKLRVQLHAGLAAQMQTSGTEIQLRIQKTGGRSEWRSHCNVA